MAPKGGRRGARLSAKDCGDRFKKTTLCRYYPGCGRGKDCAFAHAKSELRERPNLTKTRMCAGYFDGRCQLPSSECNFAHGHQELRLPEGFEAGEDAEASTTAFGADEAPPPPVALPGIGQDFPGAPVGYGFGEPRLGLSADPTYFACGLNDLQPLPVEMIMGAVPDGSPGFVVCGEASMLWQSMASTELTSTSGSSTPTAGRIGASMQSRFMFDSDAQGSSSAASSGDDATCSESAGEGGAMPSLVSRWLYDIKALSGSEQPQVGLPSTEECHIALMQAMPEVYED